MTLAMMSASKMSWSSDWVYGCDSASWLGCSIASAERAKLQAKHMAIGGDGNYHAICTCDDNIFLRRRVSKASWKKVTPPPLRGSSIKQMVIHSTEFDFRQFDIMDGGISPMVLAVITDDARVLMLEYEADTQLKSSGWKEVSHGPQGVPITDDSRLRARQVSIGNLDQSEGYLTPLIGLLDEDGMPVVLSPRKFSDVNCGEPTPYAMRLWNDTPSSKLVCGNSLVMGIDSDGSVWAHGVASMPQGASSMYHGGETWLENTFEKSGVEVVDIDVYGRDIVAVTSSGAIHCWTRDYGMLHGIYDAREGAQEPPSPNASHLRVPYACRAANLLCLRLVRECAVQKPPTRASPLPNSSRCPMATDACERPSEALSSSSPSLTRGTCSPLARSSADALCTLGWGGLEKPNRARWRHRAFRPCSAMVRNVGTGRVAPCASSRSRISFSSAGRWRHPPHLPPQGRLQRRPPRLRLPRLCARR